MDEETCIARVDYDFSLWDWVVFGLLFLVSALIGVYFAFVSRNKQQDTDDYLLGGRQMSGIPVAFSLTASFMSAITGINALPLQEMQSCKVFYWILVW